MSAMARRKLTTRGRVVAAGVCVGITGLLAGLMAATDNTGNASANQKLSQARADAVARQLVDDGVGKDVLTAKGYGQDKPVADNGTEEGRAKNRRIEFTVVK